MITNSKILQLQGIGKHYTFLNRSQWWSFDELRSYQFKRLKRLLVHAKTIPFYRETWKDFDPETDFKHIEDLQLLPILDKQTARTANLWWNKNKHFLHKTSGSTGEPFSCLVSRNARVLEDAFIYRHWTWAGYKFYDRIVHLRSYVPKAGEPLYQFDRYRNYMYLSAYHIGKNVEKYLNWIDGFDPKFIRGYPSSLFILAKTAKRKPAGKIKGIICSSETLSDEYRETIERYFGAKVYNWYGQAEITATVNECECGGLHENMEYGHIELIDGRIIATNLHNYAMPLIRYDTGDTAEDGGKCSCGRGSKTLSKILGRQDDIITDAIGSPIPSINFYTIFKDYSAFQIIRHKNLVEVRMIGKPDNRLKSEMKRRLGNIKIDYNNNPFIQNNDGKRRAVISL